MRWYEKYPERLEFEIRALEEAGFLCDVDARQRAAGRLVLNIKCRIEEVEHPLTVIFPTDYPYFAFQVFAPTLNLAHHQDPYSKLLCFVAHIESEWKTTDTVAKYLLERLPDVLRANEGGAAVAEAREGAPVTGYMQFAPGSLVMTAHCPLPDDRQRGRLIIGIERGRSANELLRGAVLQVLDLDGNLLGEADGRVKALYPDRLNARWVKLAGPPKSTVPEEVLAEAISQWPELRKPRFDGGPDVIGIVFPDEARFKEFLDLWVFIVRRRDRLLAERAGKRHPPGDKISCYLARPDRGGRDDLQARVPRLKVLAAKKIAIFGLGALGSIVAWQLARAGAGRLALIDNDTVQAGNIPRWLIGWPAAGYEKALVLASYLGQHYPLVETMPSILRVGAATVDPDIHEHEMTRVLDGVDLIVDCTVEFTVGHYLSGIAWECYVPYVWTSGTPGAWGGIVGRAIRGRTKGCWKCFRHHQINGVYPSPAADKGPNVQPVGCFSPTFTGTGFDMDLVSLMAVRLVVATLCNGSEGGYPDFEWDIGIVDLWKDGRPIVPRWATFPLDRHEACDAHD